MLRGSNLIEFLLSSVGLPRVFLRGRIESFHLILWRNVNSKIARIMLLFWSYTMLQEESSIFNSNFSDSDEIWAN